MFKIALTTGFSQWQETRKTVLNRFNGFIIRSVPKLELRNKVIGRFFTNRPLRRFRKINHPQGHSLSV